MPRIATVLLLALWPAVSPAQDPTDPWQTLAREAAQLQRLHTLIVAQEGEIVLETTVRGPGPMAPVNIKSVSKSIIAALTGIAIERGLIAGTDAKVADLLPDQLPAEPDPMLRDLTVGHLLSMQAGLRRTSGPNYGRWVASDDWVSFALGQPFEDEPGGRMLYSTGDFHILSAILTRLSERSTLALARDWLGEPLNIRVPAWQTDPQGIYFGGNNMALSPRALLQFGELYRRGGEMDGQQVLPSEWVETSWMPRARSPFSGDAYGYGWFITRACGQAVYYARGFGGQYVYVIPSVAATIVVTSDTTTRTRRGGYGRALEQFVFDSALPALMERSEASGRCLS